MFHGLASHVSKLRHILGENSSTILTGVGVAGTIATAVFTTKATFKAAEIIEEEMRVINIDADRDLNPVTLSKMDKVKLVWQEYLPPVAAASITIGCIVTANRISSKKVAALTIAAGVSERAFSEYKEKVLEKLGPREDQKIRDEIAQDRVTTNPPGPQIVVGTGEVLCMDTITGRYFNSTVELIRKAENKVNYELLHYDSCSLSFFYEEIGLEPTPYTDEVGWDLNNPLEVKFSTVMTPDQRPCIVIDFTRPPKSDFNVRKWS